MTCLTFKACGLVAFCVLLLPGFGCSSDSDPDDKGTETTGGTGGGGGTNKMLSCAVSRCPNDNASSHFDSESDCDNIWNGPCPTEYKAYQKCLLDSETCDADGQANIDSISGCASFTEALVKCSTKD
jgi:hypothetical protein